MGKLQGREDVPLNDRGEQQAIMVGEYLRQSKFNAIFTSPLLRAKETALIVNHFVGHLPLFVSDDFIEKDYGQASGMTVEKKNCCFPDGKIPEMETFDHISARVKKGLQLIRNKFPTGTVLLVAHGGVINVILSLLSGGQIGTGKTKLFNTCISHVVTDGETWKIVDYNRIDHLKSFGKVTSI